MPRPRRNDHARLTSSDPIETGADWLRLAHQQLDAFEAEARKNLEALSLPPVGDKASRQRETRRRARIETLPKLLEACLQQVQLTREALSTNPAAGKAVYHALQTGMFAHYLDTADVREQRRAKREAAIETNWKIKNEKEEAKLSAKKNAAR